MTLAITKELLGTYYLEDYGNLSLARMYKIFDQNNLIGQFFYHQDVSFFAFNNEDIKIINTEYRKFWTPIYKIIDQKHNKEIGEYKSSKIIGASFPLDSLILENQHYSFVYNNLNSFFLSNNKYLFQLKKENERIDYHFEIDYLKSGYTDINLRPIEGVIESTYNNLFPVFAGFFMIEDFLDTRERTNY